MRRDDFLPGPGPVAPLDRFESLVGAAAFWERASRDIARARHRVLVQTMSCEGDAAGEALGAALLASTARERCLLVDAYSLHVTNDTLLPWLPWRAKPLRDEARATRRLLDRLAAGGVSVAVTNPVGRNPLRFPLRNHKKLLVIDDVAYLGGINFSDHNFAWHDAMVRILDARAAEFLAAAFAADRAGRPRCAAARVGRLELIALDGESNEAALAPVMALFAGARRSVEMIGAYPTLPFTGALAEAARNGAQVTIYTPGVNNKPLVRDYLFAVAHAAPALELALLPGMTHAKAAIVDGETVLFGSVNFNLASWRSNGDLLAIGRDPGLVAA
ncbi:MAG: phospholipase D-like domain-containing protein [Novosphingobium sp.]|nr:phospholipase D-like domain-containing protein [Novosphingobium sp.]